MSPKNYISDSDREALYRARMIQETARIAWKELQRFFASGVVIVVSPELDLVEVAFQISEDNAAQVAEWMTTGQIGKVSDAQAQEWYETDALVWAVVTSPYVLVQDSGKLQ